MNSNQILSFDPSRPDFSPYGLTCVHWEPSAMSRPDHHSEIELNFLKSGFVTYLIGGRRQEIKVGKLAMFWAANPHQVIEYSEDADYIVATIPLQCFLQWRLPDYFVQPLMRGEFFIEDQEEKAEFDEHLFEQWVRDLRDGNEEMQRPVLLEMQARLTRFALGFPASENQQGLSAISNSGLSKVEQIACYIAQNYTQRLTVHKIGDAVKLNPNYAMTLFQKTFGTTLISYITQHRISHAQRLLATTDTPITEIAFLSGFLSISRFNDAFYRACGCSPREYRKSNEPLF